jgi:hypothetical protein
MAYREACPVTMGMAAVRPVRMRKEGRKGESESEERASDPLPIVSHLGVQLDPSNHTMFGRTRFALPVAPTNPFTEVGPFFLF